MGLREHLESELLDELILVAEIEPGFSVHDPPRAIGNLRFTATSAGRRSPDWEVPVSGKWCLFRTKCVVSLLEFRYVRRWKSLNAMKPEDRDMSALAKEVAKAEAKLQELEWEIEEVGQPAAHELQRRLDALRVEENALKRNLAELLGASHPDDDKRLHKIESLLDYIQREEASLKDDADFLHQSGPTTAEFAVKAGSMIVDLVLRALKRVLGDHHPLGRSVFVNHTHKDLVDRFGIARPPGSGESR